VKAGSTWYHPGVECGVVDNEIIADCLERDGLISVNQSRGWQIYFLGGSALTKNTLTAQDILCSRLYESKSPLVLVCLVLLNCSVFSGNLLDASSLLTQHLVGELVDGQGDVSLSYMLQLSARSKVHISQGRFVLGVLVRKSLL